MSRVIEVNIDRVVLRGIEPSDRKAMIEGLEAELSRILAAPLSDGRKIQSLRTPVLKLGRMPLEPGPAGGRKFGSGVARAIGRGVKP
ncbi:MAG TPA: hypothetical protein VGY94_09640 [Acidobacteriaceae bacterium]|jgi:hypothetical protein|nr:hypothetical protein [Acidobacteriaceae bacterium]